MSMGSPVYVLLQPVEAAATGTINRKTTKHVSS
jgi:hypothetical protein